MDILQSTSRGKRNICILECSAANSTMQRRLKLREVLYGRFDDSKLDVIFVECICTNEKVGSQKLKWQVRSRPYLISRVAVCMLRAQMLHSNMLQKIRSSPDYKGMPRSEALRGKCRSESLSLFVVKCILGATHITPSPRWSRWYSFSLTHGDCPLQIWEIESRTTKKFMRLSMIDRKRI